MRILHLEASSGWGGQEIRILREAQGMRERGHVLIFAVMCKGRLAEYARAADFETYELNFRRRGWLFTLFRLLRIIRRHRIDIVNTHSSLDSWIGGIAARIAGKKVIRTRHLSTPVKGGWNSRFLYKYLADYVVTTCEAIIPSLSRQSGRPLRDFRSIATGVDIEKIQADPDKIAQFRKEIGAAFLIGTACFMRSWKGIEDFLHAADLLRDEADIRWVIIGGGHAERYRRLAEEKKLQEIVHFTGHLENPFPAIAALDVFALLSTANEGVSQAILQAAFLKKPLIATPTGGLREVCLEGKTGILVPPFQPKRVAEAVLVLKKDQALRESLGNSGRQIVCQQFTFKHTLDGMEESYRRVTTKSANCRC